MPAEQSISEETWSLHKHVLVGHHENMSVKDLRELMIVKYRFHASLQQYQRRFKKWDLTKYLKESQWKDIHHALKRKYLDIDHSEVWVDDVFIDKKKLRKELPRYNLPTLTGALPGLHPAESRDKRLDIRVGLTPSIVPVAPLRLPTFDLLESLEKHNTNMLATPPMTGFANQTLANHNSRSVSQFLAVFNPSSSEKSSPSASRGIENRLYYQLQPWFAQSSPDMLIQDVRCMIRGTPDRAFNVMLSYAASVVGNHLDPDCGSDEVLEFVVRWLENTIDGGTSFLKYLITTRNPLNQATFDRLVLYATTHVKRSLLLKLLACGMDPDRPVPDRFGASTPLQSALLSASTWIYDNTFDVVMALLDAKADPNLCGLHGSTRHDTDSACCGALPVYLAAGISDGRFIDAMIAHGTFVRLCDLTDVLASGVTFMMATKLLHQFESTNDLNLRKALNSFPSHASHSLCPVQAAAKHGDVEKVRLFLKYGADPDGCGGELTPSQINALSITQLESRIASPLTIAIEQKSSCEMDDKSCAMKYHHVIELLLNAGANIDGCIWRDQSDIWLNGASCVECCDCCDQCGETAHDDRSDWFHNLPCVSERPDGDLFSHTPLQAAMIDSNNELFFSLLDMGANPNPFSGTPPLVLAVLKHDEAAIKRLIWQGALPNHTGYQLNVGNCGDAVQRSASYDALEAAASQGLINIMDLLIEAGALVNNEGANGHVLSALQAACVYRQYESAQYLLSKGAIVESTATCGHSAYLSPLHIAVFNCDIRTVELLIRYNANVNAAFSYRCQFTPAMLAIEQGHATIAGILYQHGAEIEPDTFKEAIQEDGNLRLFLTLDKLGLLDTFCARHTLTYACEHQGFTADWIFDRIMLTDNAFATTLCALVRYLPQSLPYMNKMLRQASWRPSPAEVDTLTLALVASRRRPLRPEEVGMFPQILANILDRGVDVNGYRCQACPTPYLLAMTDFDADLCKFLVGRGADTKPLHSLQYGITRLLRAAGNGDRRMVELMLELGADVNGTWAERLPHSNCCPLASVDPDIWDEWGVSDRYLGSIRSHIGLFRPPSTRYFRTAVQNAIHGDHVECALILIANGADINCPQPETRFGRTNLQIACEKGNLEMVHLLLNHGVDVNEPAGTDHGVTALQAAAIKGYIHIAQILIAAGADIGAAASPINGRTAIDGAAENGRVDMVTYLLDSYQGEEPIRSLCESASGYARKQGHMAVVELLATYRRSTE